jgi:hypothetical protein
MITVAGTPRCERLENAGCDERAFDGAMIWPGRFEHDTVQRRLREPFDKRFVTSLVIGERRVARSASWASRWSFDTSTPMVSFFIFSDLCLSFGALPPVSVQAKGKDEGDPTLARPVNRSAYSRFDPRR